MVQRFLSVGATEAWTVTTVCKNKKARLRARRSVLIISVTLCDMIGPDVREQHRRLTLSKKMAQAPNLRDPCARQVYRVRSRTVEAACSLIAHFIWPSNGPGMETQWIWTPK